MNKNLSHPTHGLSQTKFYKIWQSIRNRIKSPKHQSYHNYGAKNIKCLWKNFEEFKKDMYQSYLKHTKENFTTTIERINNKGHYSKKNCRWATRAEQNRNTSRTKLITFKGKTQCVADWAIELKIHKATLQYRIKNWSIKKALCHPIESKT